MSLAAFGLVLLAFVAIVVVTTGIPAYLALLLAAVVGAGVGLLSGAVTLDLLGALPGRLINLLENDLLQALPLYLLMGALLNRTGLAEAVFRTFAALAGRSRAAPVLAGIGLGALLGPMNGSVGASVLAMTRTVGPRLADAAVPAAAREAVIAVAGTLGVVVPPSLVLILLGDALLTAHTIASNATGGTARIINTQDLMRGALPAAALFVLLALGVAALMACRAAPEGTAHAPVPLPNRTQAIIAVATIVVIGGLLGGVAAGQFYAVEAAATGAVLLFAGALASRRLGGGELARVLSETLVGTGVLFAPLLAATTFTLVLRLHGTDKLVEGFITGLPGGADVAIIVCLLALMLSALALDAFEIIFVVVPILAPPLLMRAPDAVWVGVLILLVLQTSFLLPPFGAALMLARANLQTGARLGATIAAVTPYLVAQLVVLGLVLAVPRMTHLLDAPRPETATPDRLSPAETEKRLREMMQPGIPGLPSLPPVN
jgi:tripartite ATP-independent transporter DctM subunit